MLAEETQEQPGQPDSKGEATGEANEDSFPVVGDDAMCPDGQYRGDDDEEHDVDQRLHVCRERLAAHPRHWVCVQEENWLK